MSEEFEFERMEEIGDNEVLGVGNVKLVRGVDRFRGRLELEEDEEDEDEEDELTLFLFLLFELLDSL